MVLGRLVGLGRVVGSRGVSTNSHRVMVLNCGSSSIKFQVVDPTTGEAVLGGQADRLNTQEGRLAWKRAGKKEVVPLPCPDYPAVVEAVCQLAESEDWGMIGHRVVHGGELFLSATPVTPTFLSALAPLDSLAPLHNPRQRRAMQLTLDRYPGTPQAAVFDTSWHSSMPETAFLYALDLAWHREHGVRRYGFHGLSHSYVVQEVARRMGDQVQGQEQMPDQGQRQKKEQAAPLRVVSCHLGAGCSVAASLGGVSRDTSMGFSPLEGLVMAQRAGDMDPTIIPYMADRLGVSEGEVLRRCSQEGGLLGLAGTPDSLELETRHLAGDPEATRAIDIFCYRVAKYIASYTVPLGGPLDAIVFTGGIGEKSPVKRAKILELLGVNYSQGRNQENGSKSGGRLGQDDKGVQVWVVPTDEEGVIARHTHSLFSPLLKEAGRRIPNIVFPIRGHSPLPVKTQKRKL